MEITESTENENILKGMKCPECGALEPFEITYDSWGIVYDYGIDFYLEDDWHFNSRCICRTCEFEGEVKDFRE